jgi:hypothetical protein
VRSGGHFAARTQLNISLDIAKIDGTVFREIILDTVELDYNFLGAF